MRRLVKTGSLLAATSAAILAGAGTAAAESDARGAAANSPGVLSGNVIQVPLHVPVNLCGDTIDIIGVLDPAFGNVCVNHSERGVPA